MSKTILALCLIGTASLLEGQITTASISGYVKDSSSAAIPGVTVTATNTQTGIVTTVVTNETGAYQFA